MRRGWSPWAPTPPWTQRRWPRCWVRTWRRCGSPDLRPAGPCGAADLRTAVRRRDATWWTASARAVWRWSCARRSSDERWSFHPAGIPPHGGRRARRRRAPGAQPPDSAVLVGRGGGAGRDRRVAVGFRRQGARARRAHRGGSSRARHRGGHLDAALRGANGHGGGGLARAAQRQPSARRREPQAFRGNWPERRGGQRHY